MDPKYQLLTLAIIREALRGVIVESDASPDKLHTYGEYLQMGLLLNTPAPQRFSSTNKSAEDLPSRFVPKISPLLLLIFANHYAKLPNYTLV